jgi:hypothetical protein
MVHWIVRLSLSSLKCSDKDHPSSYVYVPTCVTDFFLQNYPSDIFIIAAQIKSCYNDDEKSQLNIVYYRFKSYVHRRAHKVPLKDPSLTMNSTPIRPCWRS